MEENPRLKKRRTGPVCARCAQLVAPSHGIEVGRKYYHKNCGEPLETNGGGLLFSPCPSPPAATPNGHSKPSVPQQTPVQNAYPWSQPITALHLRWLRAR